jgi:hypothetical protein
MNIEGSREQVWSFRVSNVADVPNATSPPEQKVIDDVAKYGFHIMNVMVDDEDKPEFSYTIGLYQTYKHPEIIIFGLEKIRKNVISHLGKDVQSGKVYLADELYDDILQDHKCTFRVVLREKFPEYFGWAMWYYDYHDFPAVQCVWPDKQQHFPWEPEFDQRCAWEQEITFS